jgi:hypothetical protein
MGEYYANSYRDERGAKGAVAHWLPEIPKGPTPIRKRARFLNALARHWNTSALLAHSINKWKVTLLFAPEAPRKMIEHAHSQLGVEHTMNNVVTVEVIFSQRNDPWGIKFSSDEGGLGAVVSTLEDALIRSSFDCYSTKSNAQLAGIVVGDTLALINGEVIGCLTHSKVINKMKKAKLPCTLTFTGRREAPAVSREDSTDSTLGANSNELSRTNLSAAGRSKPIGRDAAGNHTKSCSLSDMRRGSSGELFTEWRDTSISKTTVAKSTGISVISDEAVGTQQCSERSVDTTSLNQTIPSQTISGVLRLSSSRPSSGKQDSGVVLQEPGPSPSWEHGVSAGQLGATGASTGSITITCSASSLHIEPNPTPNSTTTAETDQTASAEGANYPASAEGVPTDVHGHKDHRVESPSVVSARAKLGANEISEEEFEVIARADRRLREEEEKEEEASFEMMVRTGQLMKNLDAPGEYIDILTGCVVVRQQAP